MLDSFIKTLIDDETTDTRNQALQYIHEHIKITSLYWFCYDNDLLVNESAETFSCEFYQAYNKEIAFTY